MSERRVLRAELTDAFLGMSTIVSHLREALDYGDRYEFLWDEHPGLREAIQEKLSRARALQTHLDSLTDWL